MYIYRGGCGTRHPLSWKVERPFGNQNYVILLLRTPGEFNIDGNRFIADMGDAVIIAPGIRYSQKCHGCEYVDDWLHIGLDESEHFSDRLPVNTHFKVSDQETCSNLIRLMLWEEAYSDQEFCKQNVNNIASVLINHLIAAYNEHENIETASPYLERLKRLRFDMKNSLMEDHSIDRHARELGVSSSRFQHVYSDIFGISFGQDLIRMRIENAELLLQTSDLPINQIAELCGYNNEIHFFRQFKKIKGTTPAKYRRHQYSILKL